MSEIILNTQKCKGCFICESLCPRKALYDSGKLSEKGYRIIAIDRSKCVLCGICYRMCPDYVFEIRD